MDGLKKSGVLMLRILGVLAIFAALAAVLFWMEDSQEVEPARFIFAGTKNDADCSILLSRDKCVMLDTGEEQDTQRILNILKKEEIEKIDCMILTHPDKDHIGGAAGILDEVIVDLIIAPYYAQENEQYTILQEKITDMGIHFLTPARNRQFQYGDMEVRIFPPEDMSYNNDNNYSLVAFVEHGDVQLLLAGDAERKRIKEIERYEFTDIDLYKVPHHGRNSTAGAGMIQRLKPEYAVVTARSPEKEIEEALKKTGSGTVCTVPEKDAVFESEGKRISREP